MRSMERPGAARILVVEDDVDMRSLVLRALTVEYQLEAAFDGVEGLEKAQTIRPDLIVTDIKMPRLPGDELVRELRKRPEFDATPILVLTGLGDEALRTRLLAEGVQDYI